MHWRQDTGIELLEFYTSVVSCNFVELTRHVDGRYIGKFHVMEYLGLDPTRRAAWAS